MSILKSDFSHIKDQDRASGTNTAMSFKDDAVTKNQSYQYAIDSYDYNGNRSPLSTVQQIVAGDTAPPGPITATSSISGYRNIEFRWQNPSDPDFTGCFIYNDLSKTNKIYELGGITPSSFSKKSFVTTSDTETKNIYVTTFDQNRNESYTPIKIYGISQAPVNLKDTVTLSIVAANGQRWEKNAYLSDNPGISPFYIYIHASTSLQNFLTYGYGVLGYASDGSWWWNDQTPTLIGNYLNYKVYKSGPVNITGVHEGETFLKVRAQDANGADLQDSMTVFIDRTAPTISTFIIDGGKTTSNSRQVQTTLTYSDGIIGTNGCGVDGYYFSTVNSLINSWNSVSTSVGTIRTSYNLPDVEKTYTLYGWVKDKAGNVSTSKTSDNNIQYIKIKDTPTGSIVFLDSGLTTYITPNINGWFKQTVQVRYTTKVPSGGPASLLIKHIYYRITTGTTWTAWTDVPVSGTEINLNLLISAQGTTGIEFYAVDSQGHAGGNCNTTVKIDLDAPTMSKTNFWSTDRISQSVNRESLLFWKKSAGIDALSGLDQTYIYRSTTISWANAHTVEAVDINKEWMIDDDDALQANKDYWYWGRFDDAADNLSGTSNPIKITSTYDWDYEYRNWISNGSFERTRYDGTKLKAWDWTYLEGKYGTDSFVLATSKDSYFGKTSLYNFHQAFTPSYTIHIPEDRRIFTLSWYKKNLTGGTWPGNGYLRIEYFKPDGDILPSPPLIPIAPVSSWTREYYNFGQNLAGNSAIPINAGYVVISFQNNYVFGYPTNQYCLDGIQWEEGNTATNFIDNQCINTQRLNAGIIDSNHIKAGSINATNIMALTITSDLIAADTITSDKIAANAITASELAANSVTAGKIAANAVTATEIAAGSITSTKIATEGLQIKSGKVPIIMVGDSSDPVNKEYTVLSPTNIYFKPYGYNEQWYYTKHIESSARAFGGVNYSFNRAYLSEDGGPISPQIIVTPTWQNLSSPSLGAMTRFTAVNATSTGFLIGDALMYGPASITPAYYTPGIAPTSGNELVTAAMSVSSAPVIMCRIRVGWLGPVGTLQRVKFRLWSSRDNVTFYQIGANDFHKVWKGGAATIDYWVNTIRSESIWAKYVKLRYVGNTNGPNTISLPNVTAFNGVPASPGAGARNWDINSLLSNMYSWISTDGFLDH